MQTIVLQSPETAYQVLSGSGDVKHPDSSKSPKCSPVTLRIPIFKGLLVPGYEERIFNGAKCRCLQGGIVFFVFFFFYQELPYVQELYLLCQARQNQKIPIARQPRVLTKYFWAFRTAACAAQRQVSLQCVIESSYPQTGALLEEEVLLTLCCTIFT